MSYFRAISQNCNDDLGVQFEELYTFYFTILSELFTTVQLLLPTTSYIQDDVLC